MGDTQQSSPPSLPTLSAQARPQSASQTVLVGVDIGSTTVKFAVLNEQNEILHEFYDRHKSVEAIE